MLTVYVFPVEEVVDNVSEEVNVEEQVVQDEVVIDQEDPSPIPGGLISISIT